MALHGRVLRGMVYVGTPPVLKRYGYGEKCRPYIDPALPVARRGDDPTGSQMSYWPGYSDIPPICRATYLDWLAGGASDTSYNAGYMFLYFYGLERRFFIDDPKVEEKQDLLEEVRRLTDLYAGNHSARRYLGEFIAYAVAATTPLEEIEPVFDNPGWDLPFSVKLAIGARLERGEPLSADWVLSWFLCHPEKSLRTAARRCQPEFIALFRKRFEARFPGGLKVNKPRKFLQTTYEAASQEFSASVSPTIDGKPLPDISSLRKPVEIGQEIADAVMNDLEKFSRYLGRNPDGRGSVEAHALLPIELRDLFPSKELDKLAAWAEGVVREGGLIPVGDVLERLEGERPEKPGKRQLTGAADALARLGFGMAPDPRFGLRSPRLGEPVVLFDLGGPVEQLEDVSSVFRATLLEVALASFVAHADGVISGLERRALSAKIDQVEGVSDDERRRLHANLAWFLAVPPDMTLLRRRLKDAGDDQQAAIRSVLVSAAHADGIVKAEEVAEIEKVYRALGLDPNLVYSDLHAGDVADAPMRVRAAQPGRAGEAIPAEAAPAGRGLDAARIASIRQDTDRVSAVLADIFTEAEPETDDNTGSPGGKLTGLDARHTALIRDLLAQTHWSEDAFADLAARHGLLSAGALETINEWSYGAYEEALLEEYDGYEVSPDIAEALADEFEKEN
ncbi:TerB N-terminal domain-containing protein [Glycocaulis sp.]|uniref:tellurite resistance TerB family protein n=1 Tax=Glycocaulis sp. TaxID=1969725 RepID=UPI00345C4CB9